MTTVTPLTSAAEAQSSANAAQSIAAEPASETDTDFDDFLTLLTAQLRNQDPLNPLDSTQFVEQLATFTGVEQQVGTNTRLDQLIEQDASDQLSDLASWIGQEVRALGVSFAFDGESLSIDVPADAEAQRVSAVILDDIGREVATLSADPDGDTLVWDGSTSSGAQAAPGVYNVEFIYSYGDPGDPNAQEPRTVPAEAFGRVREARLESDGSSVLILENGEIVTPSAITAVRTPPAVEE